MRLIVRIENSSHANACATQNQNTDNCASTFIACAACFICVSRAIDVESVLFVVDGNWSPWSGWSGCGAGLCGGNKKVRTRSCTNPQPTGGGKKCAGNSFEEASCPGNVKKVIRQKMHTVFFRKTVNICVSVCFHVFVHEEIKVIFKRKVLKHDDNLLPWLNFFFQLMVVGVPGEVGVSVAKHVEVPWWPERGTAIIQSLKMEENHVIQRAQKKPRPTATSLVIVSQEQLESLPDRK